MANQRFRNSGNDPNFDLDEYIYQKSSEENEELFPEKEIDYPKPTAKRNLIAVLMFSAIAGFWLFSNGPANISFFDNDGYNVNVEVPNIEIPEFESFIAPRPAPPATPVPTGDFSTAYLDYLQELNETFPDQFSGSASQGMYNGGVPIEYLTDLNEAGYLDQFSYSAIIGLFNGGVPNEYLQQMDAAGYLDDFSYSAVIGLYNGGVSTQYLDEMQSAGYLDEFSYSAVIGLFNGGVTLNYLNSLNTAGFLETFSYSGIIGLYNSGVPVEFLKVLDDRNLLDDMSYSEVIQAYNADN